MIKGDVHLRCRRSYLVYMRFSPSREANVASDVQNTVSGAEKGRCATPACGKEIRLFSYIYIYM